MTPPNTPSNTQHADIAPSTINYYWPDDYIYVLYKLANIKALAGKSLADFEYLRCPEKRHLTVLNILRTLYWNFGIKIENIVFHTDLFKKYRTHEYGRVMEQIEKHEGDWQGRKKVLDNKFDFEDIIEDPFGLFDMDEFIEFSTDFPKEALTKIQDCLKNYIEAYINEALKIDRDNVTVFSEQKRLFSQLLIDLAEQYGDSFIIKNNDVNIVREKQVYFLHNLAAFEQLGLIQILHLDILDRESSPFSQEEEYQAKIEVLPSLKKLVSHPEKEPTAVYHFHPYNPPSGDLKIGQFPGISFSKIPAFAVNYFYNLHHFSKTSKNYQDFNAYLANQGKDPISSNDFRLRINEINDKIKKTTGGVIQELIVQEKNSGKTAKKESNSYKWNDEII